MDEYQDQSHPRRGLSSRLFASCEGDPKGSIIRTWALSLLLICIFLIIACWEVSRLDESGASKALKVAAGWTGITQLVLAVLGTFILKRFSTPFAIGFLIGLVLVTAQQNVLLFISFHTINHTTTNHHVNATFANFALTLSMLYTFFATVLIKFREHIFVKPPHVPGADRQSNNLNDSRDSKTLNTALDSESYTSSVVATS